MNTAHSLTYGTETLRFTPKGNVVVVDHLFPNGTYPYRPGVGRFGKQMSLAAARKRYAEALRSGWAKA